MSHATFSRREWLNRAATLFAAGSLLHTEPFVLRAADTDLDRNDREKPASFTIGFSLYGMRSLKLADALKACADIGYEAVELVTIAGWPADPSALSVSDRADVRQRLEDHRLALPALMENLVLKTDAASHRKNLDRLKLSADLGRELSPDRPPVVETVLGGSPAKWDELKSPMADALRDWAKVAEETKTIVAIKPHVGGAVHTPEGALWLVEQVGSPWIRLTYDFSHYRLRGIGLKESLAALLPQTSFIHVKDAKGTAASFQFLLPGEGDVDYPLYFTLLKDAGYRGSVMVEVSGQLHTKPGYDPLAAARKSHDHLAAALAKAGLRRGR